MVRQVTILVAALALVSVAHAQDQPSYGRLLIVKTSRWGDSISGVVSNLGPGKMCSVVVQATTFAEQDVIVGDTSRARVVTDQVGDLDRDQDANFNLPSVVVKGRMPSIAVHGVACR